MLNKVINKIILLIEKIYYYSIIKKMPKYGKNIRISIGTRIDLPQYVSFGENVYIGKFSWFSIAQVSQEIIPKVEIGDNTYIGNNFLLSCVEEIKIGKNVMISDRCFIGDTEHCFDKKDIPIKEQPLLSAGKVEIGDDCWIGVGTSILPNVKIGKHCVVGANSVVTKDIPDYHIAVGNPTKVIKKIVCAAQ